MSKKNKAVVAAKQAFEYIGIFGIFAMANMVLLGNLIISGS